MIKTVTKVGNSQGIIFDSAIMEMAHLKVGDSVNLEIHEGGTITLTPLRPQIDPGRAAESARRLIQMNDELFRRLS